MVTMEQEKGEMKRKKPALEDGEQPIFIHTPYLNRCARARMNRSLNPDRVNLIHFPFERDEIGGGGMVWWSAVKVGVWALYEQSLDASQCFLEGTRFLTSL